MHKLYHYKLRVSMAKHNVTFSKDNEYYTPTGSFLTK